MPDLSQSVSLRSIRSYCLVKLKKIYHYSVCPDRLFRIVFINRQDDFDLRYGFFDNPVSRSGALCIIVFMDLRLTGICRDFCRLAFHSNSMLLEYN